MEVGRGLVAVPCPALYADTLFPAPTLSPLPPVHCNCFCYRALVRRTPPNTLLPCQKLQTTLCLLFCVTHSFSHQNNSYNSNRVLVRRTPPTLQPCLTAQTA